MKPCGSINGHLSAQRSLSLPDTLLPDTSSLTYVTQRLVDRYGMAGRTAYLYLFRVQPGSDFVLLIPDAAQVIDAWIDDGAGLQVTTANTAIDRCRTALDHRIAHAPQNTQERRQHMARVVMFSIDLQSAERISVDLFSRALFFTPKGDRRVGEIWLPTADSWYSSARARESDAEG